MTINSGAAEGLQKAHDFIKKVGIYYLATLDGDQPRVRPFGTIVIFGGSLCLQTGKVKDVSKQIAKNPKIEISAFDGQGAWIRLAATAVNDDGIEAKKFMLESYPQLKDRYSVDDPNTQILRLKDATATFCRMDGTPPETFKF